MPDATEIAEWMIEEIRAAAPRRTYQQTLVRKMREKFGPEWSYTNKNGNQAFDKKVLAEFGRLKDEFVYWDRSDQSWTIVDQERLDRIRERESIRKAWRAERDRKMAE